MHIPLRTTLLQAGWMLALSSAALANPIELLEELNSAGRGTGPGPGGDDFLADSGPSYLTVYDGKLFFTADDGAHGRELWAYDGNSCAMVVDIRSSDTYGSNPSDMALAGGELYFVADSGAGFGQELYRVIPDPAVAPPLSNGGFESGAFAPWVLTGAGAVAYDTVFDPALAPAGGMYMGYITTLNNEGAEDFGFFDDNPDIDGDGERETEYSSLSIRFSVPTPGRVSFDLNLLTDEVLGGTVPDVGEADLFGLTTGDIRNGPYLLLFAVAPSDDSYAGTARQLTPAAFSTERIEESNFGVFPTLPDASRYQGQTGFSKHGFAVEPGEHTWTFFVADSHTDGVSSGMLIDNLRFARRPDYGGGFTNFGTVTIAPAFELDGAGNNVDSIAFYEAPNPSNTLMFVTAKGNDLVEVWQYPFQGNELAPIQFSDNVNGVAVDQEHDLLYVSDREVTVFSLPGLQARGAFGQGILGVGENNLDLLKQPDGETVVYVSDDHKVHRFAASTTNYLGFFSPPVSSIETLLADDFHQSILVPEEQGPAGNPGVYAFHPDGAPFERGGTNLFGELGIFEADEEGIVLYTFPSSGVGDDGTGFIIVSDQRSSQTDFEFFDRRTWRHLGTLRLEGVSNTDGIASTQRPLPGYPLGVFAAVNDDTTTALVGWHTILEAIGTPYEVWSHSKGLTAGVNAGFLDDPDGDGVANIQEFSTDGDPLAGDRGGTERLQILEADGVYQFHYTFPARNGAVFVGSGPLNSTVDGLVYTLAGGLGLRDSSAGVEEVVPPLTDGMPALRAGWSYRTFRLSNAVPDLGNGYLRLTVAPAP